MKTATPLETKTSDGMMNTLTGLFKSNVREYGMLIALIAVMVFFQICQSNVIFDLLNQNEPIRFAVFRCVSDSVGNGFINGTNIYFLTMFVRCTADTRTVGAAKNAHRQFSPPSPHQPG